MIPSFSFKKPLANKTRTFLLLHINSEIKQRKKVSMLINSISLSVRNKTFDSLEINITNPREYGRSFSSIQKEATFLDRLHSPSILQSPSLTNISILEEGFTLHKQIISRQKLLHSNLKLGFTHNITSPQSEIVDFNQQNKLSELKKQGFKTLRRIAKELKCYNKNSHKEKSNDKTKNMNNQYNSLEMYLHKNKRSNLKWGNSCLRAKSAHMGDDIKKEGKVIRFKLNKENDNTKNNISVIIKESKIIKRKEYKQKSIQYKSNMLNVSCLESKKNTKHILKNSNDNHNKIKLNRRTGASYIITVNGTQQPS